MAPIPRKPEDGPVFFFSHRAHHRYGCFSNWADAPFVLEGNRFANSEQAMMHAKATLFGDADMAAKILRETDPRKAKALGRKVKNFDFEVWSANARTLVGKILLAKFEQNENAGKVLLSTGERFIAQAAPKDALWGIGLSEKLAKNVPPSVWPGRNWLGEMLGARCARSYAPASTATRRNGWRPRMAPSSSSATAIPTATAASPTGPTRPSSSRGTASQTRSRP
jgi:ribA/ribD-fused uncharacterized protein